MWWTLINTPRKSHKWNGIFLCTQAEVLVDASVVRSGRNLTVVAVEFKLKKTEQLIYTARATFYNRPVAMLWSLCGSNIIQYWNLNLNLSPISCKNSLKCAVVHHIKRNTCYSANCGHWHLIYMRVIWWNIVQILSVFFQMFEVNCGIVLKSRLILHFKCWN